MNKNNKFFNTRTIAFVSMYLAIMIILNFIPQVGYINIGITSFTTLLIPVTFMSIHYGWKGALLAWFIFGSLYFGQIFISFAGVLGVIGWDGAFVVYFVGRLMVGVFMSIIIKIMEIIEFKNFSIKSRFWWISLKVILVAVFGSILNGFMFMILWYAVDPYKSVETLTIFLTNFSIAFAIEIPMTTFVSISAIPLLKYAKQSEENYRKNTY